MSLSNSKLLSNNIFSNLLFASLYIATFAYVWKTYCVPVWHAYFYYDVPHSEFYEAIGYLVALVPVLFYRGIKNVSSCRGHRTMCVSYGDRKKVLNRR